LEKCLFAKVAIALDQDTEEKLQCAKAKRFPTMLTSSTTEPLSVLWSTWTVQGPAIAGRLYSGWTGADCSQLQCAFCAYIQSVSRATLVENILATKGQLGLKHKDFLFSE